MDTGYSLKQVLAVAKVHPFYNPQVEYPPTAEEAQQIANSIDKYDNEGVDISAVPLATKETLYPTINRLWCDTNPKNPYRQSAYLSTTGGGSNSKPMIFATDVFENRRHRAAAAALARTCGIVEPGDVTLSVHSCGNFYRALDLMTEIFEMAGGAVFCAGPGMPDREVVDAIAHYRVNVISGDGSQMLHIANYIASLPVEEQAKINITKVIYTSEPLSRDQRKVIKSILKDAEIYSVLGSCEAGPWAVANFSITGEPDEDGVDFIFDTRMMALEVLPTDAMDAGTAGSKVHAVPDGEKGILVQTSLSRLRNPLIRYNTGDLASIRHFPVTERIPKEVAQHLRIVRLFGRDRRFSFKFYGEHFEFQIVKALIHTDGWGILQYQLVLDTDPATKATLLTIRLYRAEDATNGKSLVPRENIIEELEKFFILCPGAENYFKVEFVKDLNGFEKSKTGVKVMNFVDRSIH